MVKRCECVTCDERFEGSTSHKIKKPVTEHWLETGHRHYRRIKGWGDYTFPVLDLDTEDEEPEVEEISEDIPLQPWEDFDERDVPTSKREIRALLQEYVPYEKHEREVKKLRQEVGSLKADLADLADLDGGQGAEQTVDLDPIEDRLKSIEDKLNSLDERTVGWEEIVDDKVAAVEEKVKADVKADLKEKGQTLLELRGMIKEMRQDSVADVVIGADGPACSVPVCEQAVATTVPTYVCKGGVPVHERDLGVCKTHAARSEAMLVIEETDASAIRKLAAEWVDLIGDDGFEIYGPKNLKVRFYDAFNKRAEKEGVRTLDKKEHLGKDPYGHHGKD